MLGGPLLPRAIGDGGGGTGTGSGETPLSATSSESPLLLRYLLNGGALTPDCTFATKAIAVGFSEERYLFCNQVSSNINAPH